MFSSWLSNAPRVFDWLIHTTWQAGLLALVVFTVTWLLRDRLQPRWRFALWLIVFARLAIPVAPAAPWSVFQIISLSSVPAIAGGTNLQPVIPPQIAAEQGDSQKGDPAVDVGRTLAPGESGIRELAVSPTRAPVTVVSRAGSAAAFIQLFVLIWFAGVMILFCRLVGSAVQLHRRQRQWQEISDLNILSVLQQCCSDLRISRAVSLYVTPENLGPAACGIFHPRIVLPQTVLALLSRDELRLVLLHELVHVRRRDVLMDHLTGLIVILHWYNPVAWWSRSCLRSERELACDAAVLERSPAAQAANYGHVILKTIELLAAPVTPLPGLVGMFGRGSVTLVHRRIHLILDYRRPTWTSPLLGAALLLILGLVGLTDAQTQQQQTTSTQKPVQANAPSPPASKLPAAKVTPETVAKKDPGRATMPITVSGRALGLDNKPIIGADIFLASPHTTGHPLAETKTDREGRYRFEKIPLPIDRSFPYASQEYGTFEVFGRAEGLGFAWQPQQTFEFDVAHVDQLFDQFGRSLEGRRPRKFGSEDPIELDLHFGPSMKLRGRLVNDLGEPLANAKLTIRSSQSVVDEKDLAVVPEGELQSFNSPSLVPDAVKVRRTDKEGRFEFTDLPRDMKFWLDLRLAGHAPRMIWASTVEGLKATAPNDRIYSGDFEIVLTRPRKVKLQIIYGDTGKPASKVGVGGGDAENMTSFWESTDDAGQVELPLPDGQYFLSLSPRYKSAYLNTKFDLVVSAETTQQPIILKIRPAAIVEIKLVDAATGEPLPGADVWFEELVVGAAEPQRSTYNYRSWEVETRLSHFEEPRTDKDGKTRFMFEPGEHLIGVALGSRPEGYEPGEPAGKRINCRVGETATVEFTMHKQQARK